MNSSRLTGGLPARDLLVDAKAGRPSPILLDLFCGVGGAAMGYHRAGFTVVGVDLKRQPHYPFEFIQADALALLLILDKSKFAAVHASPPCYLWSEAAGTRQIDSKHPDLITPLRPLLRQWDLPYVIENVRNAPLKHPAFICGTRLNLHITVDGTEYRLRRHRKFETNWALITPGCSCGRDPRPAMDVTGHGGVSRPGRTFRGTAQNRRDILGVQWGARHELADVVPPAYTELIGRQLIHEVERRKHG